MLTDERAGDYDEDKPHEAGGDLDGVGRGAQRVLDWSGGAVTSRNAKLMAADLLALVAEVRRLRAEVLQLKAEAGSVPADEVFGSLLTRCSPPSFTASSLSETDYATE